MNQKHEPRFRNAIASIVIGLIVISLGKIRWLPEYYFTYGGILIALLAVVEIAFLANEAKPQKAEPGTLKIELWRTETECDWIDLDITVDEWRILAQKVTMNDYKFTVRSVGDDLYYKDGLTKRLDECGILDKAGKGFVVTNPWGVNFFSRLADDKLGVLKMVQE